MLSFGQNPTNTLSGLFKNTSKKSLYSTLDFDGKGKVKISDSNLYDYFERNDSIVIFVDRTQFILKKHKNNSLKGIGYWINDEIFKSDSKSFVYTQDSPTANKRAQLLANYYDINFKNTFNQVFDENLDYNQFINDLIIKNNVACEQDFDLACVQVFILKFSENLGGVTKIFDTNEIENLIVNPDKNLEDLGHKIIDLGNAEGYGLLANYYLYLRDNEKFNYYKNIGLEKGCNLCFSLEIDQLVEDIKDDIEN